MAAAARVPAGMPLSLAPGAGDRKFRAYDKATGRVVWEMDLPAGTTGAPMTVYSSTASSTSCSPVGSREHAAEYIALSLP